MKTRSLALGILLGIAVVVSLGIVYIDTIQNYWYVNDGFVKLIVSNQAQAVITIDTNTLALGVNTNNVNRSIVMKGRAATVNTTGNGENRFTLGAVQWIGGDGGDTTANNANGGAGGASTVVGGAGGKSTGSTTNAIGGNAGNGIVEGGSGGVPTAPATNSLMGGAGGNAVLSGGPGGQPTFATTNAVGGPGGGVQGSGANGVTPSGGYFRKPGAGGDVTFTAGNSGSSALRTNGSNGGSVNFTAGNAGNVTGSGVLGDAGVAGTVNFTGGNGASGSSGGTNSDGGHVFIAGGSPASGARPGDTYIGRLAAGTGRGGLVIGISNSAVLTNVMFVRTNLDFPSTLAQTDSDIPVLALTGVTNAIVNVGPPTPAILTGSAWSGFCSNGTVFVRFSVYGLVAKDPGVGDFAVLISAYR